MQIFHHKNKDKTYWNPYIAAFFIAMVIFALLVIFFVYFQPTPVSAVIFVIVLFFLAIALTIFVFLHNFKSDSIYVLDEDGVLWSLFLQGLADYAIHKETNLINRFNAPGKHYKANQAQRYINDKDTFIEDIIHHLKENPRKNIQTYSKQGALIEQMKNPRVIENGYTQFKVAFINQKGKEKSRQISNGYVGLKDVLNK